MTIIHIDANKQAWTRMHGELWQVKSDVELKPGQKVKILKTEGVVLIGTKLYVKN